MRTVIVAYWAGPQLRPFPSDESKQWGVHCPKIREQDRLEEAKQVTCIQ